MEVSLKLLGHIQADGFVTSSQPVHIRLQAGYDLKVVMVLASSHPMNLVNVTFSKVHH